MDEFRKIIFENLFLFLLLIFVAGILVGVMGFKRKKVKTKAIFEKPSDYILGMYSLFMGEMDNAVKRLSAVVEKVPHAIEVYLALGNIYRNRGQLEKAIKIHKDLLLRTDLTTEARILALDALGTDYRVGGFLDRSLNTFKEALALDPKDTYALTQLVKLCEDRNEWDTAYEYAKQLFKRSKLVDAKTLSYQLVKKGESLEEEGKSFKSYICYKKALRILPENTIASLSLVKLHLKEGRREKARTTFETALERFPQKSYIFFEYLKKIYKDEYLSKLREIALMRHQKRALLLYLEEMKKENNIEEIKLTLLDLAKNFPKSRNLEMALFQFAKEEKISFEDIKNIANILSSSRELKDPFICIYCGYKTMDVLPRCPNCKEWNSFSDSES
jgi:lipopolysaccharide biosynthesis regulator YciM